ncbi:polyprenyl synthetase family protein [Candidatus Uhrbacteria bacterium]|nr:polyprenyl synthetase family protein [Candidatus Uhrbacteria bacterium]
MEIKAFKSRFDRVLRRELGRRVAENKRLTTDKRIREVVAYAERLVMAGGKRVRPYLAFIAYKVVGGKKDQEILETIVGLELFHAFALVHDDIMDRGTLRHGLPTTHVRFGDSQAILLGDLLFNWANACLNGTKAYPIFQKMIDEVITGQMLDVDSMSRQSVEMGMIEERHRLKTASYTFVRPMQIGFAMAGGSSKLMKFAEAYGFPLGVGFQIQDDWLDLTSKPDEIGKTAFSDLRDGQHTLFTQYIVERGTSGEKKELKKIFGKSLTEKDRAKISKLFEESGAIEHGCMLIETYFEEAEEAVVATSLSKKQREPFLKLVEYLRERAS